MGPIGTNWYVLQVRAGKENSSVRDIKAYNAEKGINDVSPFVPMKERFFKTAKNKNDPKVELYTLFPGYAFAETPMGDSDFLQYIKGVHGRYRYLMKPVQYGDSHDFALRMEERLPLMQLMNHEWCVKVSSGFMENGRVKIISSALKGFDGEIKKLDRYKMRAWVEFDMFNRKHLVEVGLEVLERADIEKI